MTHEQSQLGPAKGVSSGSKKRQQIAGLYDMEETIGEGHYAVVKLARHVFTGNAIILGPSHSMEST